CQGTIKGNPYVFPSDAGGHRDAGDINNIFVHRNWKRGGFKLNTQVCRHLSAKIILDADPGQMGLVQTLLGHKSLKTTETYYGRVNQIIAQRWYQEALAKAARDIDAELL
ncbi:MAG TPA: site-specific integrase, partial [Stellaceae bacterium]|nr:site-specific integrase [Stellaceae bacterium]